MVFLIFAYNYFTLLAMLWTNKNLLNFLGNTSTIWYVSFWPCQPFEVWSFCWQNRHCKSIFPIHTNDNPIWIYITNYTCWFGRLENLIMIKTFCERTVTEKGNKVQQNLNENYKLLTANSLSLNMTGCIFKIMLVSIDSVIYLYIEYI